MKLITEEKKINYQLPVFARELYLLTKSKQIGWFISDKFILPFYIDKKLIFKRMIFTTEVICITPNSTISEEKIFLNQIVNYATQHTLCDFIAKAQGNVVFNAYPNRSIFIPWGTYEINLHQTNEELFNSFNGKCRNAIRKAIKESVIVKNTYEINLIYKNINDMFQRQKSMHSISYNYLLNLKDKLPNNVLFLLAEHHNKIQGSLLVLFDKDKGYAMYAGSIASPKTGSLDLLHFEAMKLLQEKNIPIYDFVGTRINPESNSKQEGIDRFKRKFNPTLKEGFAFKVIINKNRYYLFNTLVKLYFKLKGYQYIDIIDEIKNNLQKSALYDI